MPASDRSGALHLGLEHSMVPAKSAIDVDSPSNCNYDSPSSIAWSSLSLRCSTSAQEEDTSDSSFVDLAGEQSATTQCSEAVEDVDPDLLLRKTVSLPNRVFELDPHQRDGEATASCASPTIDVRVSQQLDQRTTSQRKSQISAKVKTHRRLHSTLQDDSFLGSLPGVSVPIHEDVMTDAEEVVFLKDQLNATVQALEAVKAEVQELKRTVAAVADPYLHETRRLGCLKSLSSKHGSDTSSVADAAYTKINSDIFPPMDSKISSRALHDPIDFPRLEPNRRTANPLVSPRDAFAASAFLAGGIDHFRANDSTKHAGPAGFYSRFGTSLPNMERRQSEPCRSASSMLKGASLPVPVGRYDHLTFFPGTSNTPPPHLQTTESFDHTSIWTQNLDDITADTEAKEETDGSDQTPERIEHINYRRIMDRNAEVNWACVIDRIVQTNDQQASVALQQKIKIAPTEQKNVIIDAIILQAFPLMVNRFGNFLIQRCFEHGTPEQVFLLGKAIRGNVLSLSKDAFGCHVIQKAFDNVPDSLKLDFVSEMLTQIKETVTHRYACHVWQKLFEVRWLEKPPQIMSYVNAELVGNWDQVALGETGSLVVQNIFENCTEHERRPCIEEVLHNVSTIIKGQWGNWVIQHIVEHGSFNDRERALEAVLQHAVEYSVDQYASKVIEKAIKSGDVVVLGKYLDSVMQAKTNDQARPRMPLIDIASDQYGNYLIQYILTHGNPVQKSLVANQIRKHMVSMRGSRYGAKVAFTVEKMRSGDYDDRNQRDYRSAYISKTRPFHGTSHRGHHRGLSRE